MVNKTYTYTVQPGDDFSDKKPGDKVTAEKMSGGSSTLVRWEDGSLEEIPTDYFNQCFELE